MTTTAYTVEQTADLLTHLLVDANPDIPAMRSAEAVDRLRGYGIPEATISDAIVDLLRHQYLILLPTHEMALTTAGHLLYLHTQHECPDCHGESTVGPDEHPCPMCDGEGGW